MRSGTSNPDRTKKQSSLWALGALAFGVIGNVFNLAGVAESVVKWKKFFQEGFLEPWLVLKAAIYNALPISIPAEFQSALIGFCASMFILGYAARDMKATLTESSRSKGFALAVLDIVVPIIIFFGSIQLWILVLDGGFGQIIQLFPDVGLTGVVFFMIFWVVLAPICIWVMNDPTTEPSAGSAARRLALSTAAIFVCFVALLFLAADFSSELA